MENPSDSGPDMEDDDSVLSTPKPKLRWGAPGGPGWGGQDMWIPAGVWEKANSRIQAEPRKASGTHGAVV